MKKQDEVKEMIQSEKERLAWLEERINGFINETRMTTNMESIQSIAKQAEITQKEIELARERVRTLNWVLSN